MPLEILNKPGRLTEEEFGIMKEHAAESARILSDAGDYRRRRAESPGAPRAVRRIGVSTEARG